MSPDPAAVSDAPLRFGDRPVVTEKPDEPTADPAAAEEPNEPEERTEPKEPEEPSERTEPKESEERTPSKESVEPEERTPSKESVEPDEPHVPAGPPPLRAPSDEPVVVARKDKDKEQKDEESAEVTTAEPEVTLPPGPTRAERRAARAAEAAALAAAPPEDPSRRQRKQDVKRRARKVKRIVRRLDAWSVMKVAFIFNLCVYVVTMVAVVLLWNVADGAGVIDNVESFIEDLGAFETFQFEPDQLLQATALGGAVLAVLATGLIALGAVLFNLISDLVGGIRLTVIEEPGSTPLKKPRSGGSDEEGSGTVAEPSGSS